LTFCWAQQPTQPTPPNQQLPPGSGGIRTPPPPLPTYPDVREPGETGFYVGLYVWLPQQQPSFNKGHGSDFTDSSFLTFQGQPKYAEAAEIGIAVGLHNAITLSYFQDQAAGDFTNSQELVVWNQTYPAGNLISTNYRLQNAKVTFDYLTWPYPVQYSKFRLKTKYGVSYTNIKSGFDMPLVPTTDSAGNPLLDANGNPISYAASGSHWFILPSLGINVSEYVTRHLRLEGNVSGFAIPHHSTEWDADGSINFRTGHLELRVGAKAFHFKTSPTADFFMYGTQASAFVGMRWYSQ
jgi:hypothetical protein